MKETWFRLLSARMDTAVTPLQMCLQASTIANHGTRYASHLVKSIETYDGTVLEETQPEVINQFDMQESTYEAVRDGMIAAATRTNIGLSSSELGYSVAVKTGTPQVDSGGVRTNNCAIAFTEGGSQYLHCRNAGRRHQCQPADPADHRRLQSSASTSPAGDCYALSTRIERCFVTIIQNHKEFTKMF